MNISLESLGKTEGLVIWMGPFTRFTWLPGSGGPMAKVSIEGVYVGAIAHFACNVCNTECL